MFFKVKVLDKLAPGRLDIKYGPGEYIKRVKKVCERITQEPNTKEGKAVDLRIFYSCLHKEPSELQN